MYEQRIDVQQLKTLLHPDVKGPRDLLVAVIKVSREAPEECGHREIDLWVATVHRGVYEPSLTVDTAHKVAPPKVSVEQRTSAIGLLEKPFEVERLDPRS